MFCLNEPCSTDHSHSHNSLQPHSEEAVVPHNQTQHRNKQHRRSDSLFEFVLQSIDVQEVEQVVGPSAEDLTPSWQKHLHESSTPSVLTDFSSLLGDDIALDASFDAATSATTVPTTTTTATANTATTTAALPTSVTAVTGVAATTTCADSTASTLHMVQQQMQQLLFHQQQQFMHQQHQQEQLKLSEQEEEEEERSLQGSDDEEEEEEEDDDDEMDVEGGADEEYNPRGSGASRRQSSRRSKPSSKAVAAEMSSAESPSPVERSPRQSLSANRPVNCDVAHFRDLTDAQLAHIDFKDLMKLMKDAKMSSKEIEATKQHRRRLKNRLSARICSNKKREKCSELAVSNRKLHDRIAQLERENRQLRASQEELQVQDRRRSEAVRLFLLRQGMTADQAQQTLALLLSA